VSFTPVDGNPGTVGSGGAGTGGADAGSGGGGGGWFGGGSGGGVAGPSDGDGGGGGGSGTGPAGTVFGSGTQANDGVVTIAYDTSQGCHVPAERAEPVVAPIRFTG
jgi:hypothetical protein